MKIIIGSRALAAYYPAYIGQDRLAKADYDLLMSTANFNAWHAQNKAHIVRLIPKTAHKHQAVLHKNGIKTVYEIELDSLPSVAYLMARGERCFSRVIDPYGNRYETLPLADLYATKRAHIHYPIHFEKNVKDYLFLKEECDKRGLKYDPRYAYLRKKETKARINRPTPKLNMTNSEFFSDKHYKVKYYFIHDDIHHAVKHYDVPVYEMMKNNQNMALCLESKWDALDDAIKLACVHEECYVIAFERFLMNGEKNIQKAFKLALQRVCTTLTSGWFREYALNHYHQVLESYSVDYASNIVYAYQNGQLNYVDNLPENDKIKASRIINYDFYHSK